MPEEPSSPYRPGMERWHGSTTRAVVGDALLAVVLAVGALLESTQPGRGYSTPGLMVPATLLTTLPVALRRRAPLAVLLVATSAQATTALLSHTPASAVLFLALLVALYTAAVQGSRATVVLAVLAAVAGGTLTELRDPATQSVAEAIPTYLVMAAVVGLALVVRRSRAQAARLRALADELAASREEAEHSAVLAERLRIAREMHDVLAHSVSVMVLQAGAARVSLHDEGPQARALLGQVEDVGREALLELREILGLLRDPDVSTAPSLTPASGDLDALLSSVRAAGLPVVLLGGEELAQLPPSLGLTVFRVVQEALTNTLKHAGRSATEVEIAVSTDAVVVQVTDSGPEEGVTGVPGSGRGLQGLRERVRAHDGAVECGPVPGGGWRVRAVLARAHAGSPVEVPA